MLSQQIKSFSDDYLLQQTHKLVSEERRISTDILWHLREVDARMLYAKRGYEGLFEYCTKGLGYSNGAAGRRIAAMRLLRDLPQQTTAALKDGRVSLSSAAAVQTFLQREKREQGKSYSVAQKAELLERVVGKSERETEKILASISPQSVPTERERVLDGDQTEIRFVASDRLLAKLKRVRELSSHKQVHASYAELLEFMTDVAIVALEKKRGLTSSAENLNHPQPQSSVTNCASSPAYIAAPVRRAVWKRDRGQCTYRDSKTGKSCSSRSFLEIDHIRPLGMNGSNVLSNLRLRCRTHNRLWAVQSYGRSKIERKIAHSLQSRSGAEPKQAPSTS